LVNPYILLEYVGKMYPGNVVALDGVLRYISLRVLSA